MNIPDPFTPAESQAAEPLRFGHAAAFRLGIRAATVIYGVERTDSGDTLLSLGDLTTAPDAELYGCSVVRLSREECDTLITRLIR